MSETTIAETKSKGDADYEAVADRLLAGMQQLESIMQSDRVEIDRLKAETHLLREESLRLEVETQATLSRLKLAFI